MDELLTISKSIPAEMIRKIDDLNNQAWEVHITEPNLGLELSSEAKKLSEEYAYQKGLAYAIRNMGVSHRYLSNLDYKLFHKYKSEVFKDEQESKQKYLSIQHEMEKLQQEAEINRLTNVVMKEKNEELETVNGNGIPQKVVDKIFQPFFTTKPTGEGTGLGLSLSYDIVKAHGGAIKVETKEGEGSDFIIQLPIV